MFANLARALNFDENIREEALIDWEALKATVPDEVARCLETFKGIRISDTRDCLLAALRTLKDPDAAKVFEVNFKSLERLWEAVSPDPCLYEHRYVYSWLCGIYIAYRRRQRGAASSATYGELSAKTRELIQQNTTFMDLAMALPVFRIDKDTVYLSTCARQMLAHLRDNQLLLPGWSSSKGGRMRVEDSLLAESMNPGYAALGFDPDDPTPPVLGPAVSELVTIDAAR